MAVFGLTLWQVTQNSQANLFDRKKNVGLHHLALTVESQEQLDHVHQIMLQAEDVEIEFAPEPVGNGPRMHMMVYEPGGIRIEFIWSGVE